MALTRIYNIYTYTLVDRRLDLKLAHWENCTETKYTKYTKSWFGTTCKHYNPVLLHSIISIDQHKANVFAVIELLMEFSRNQGGDAILSVLVLCKANSRYRTATILSQQKEAQSSESRLGIMAFGEFKFHPLRSLFYLFATVILWSMCRVKSLSHSYRTYKLSRMNYPICRVHFSTFVISSQ